ncbi:MAG: response regulator [Bacteroidetes bacterium HGW-Bacteroidetes-12]|nr:MAG: response regulator [Bacteroidetes bacterium HGW-Bacteroidetes-12]
MNDMIKLLYVDDEPINLMLFKTMLRKKYNIITAESGFNGLEELSLNPDIRIVISDMKMPGMNGLEFIKIAKEKYPNVIFCILTGYEITDEIMLALEANLIYQYFQKPFKVVEIENAIKGAVKDLIK